MSLRRLNTNFSVSANRWLIQRYACLEEHLFTTLAGWIWSTPAFDHKIEFGRLSYEDAQHADALRRRADELLPPTAEPPRPQDLAALGALCNEVANATDPIEQFVGIFRVLKPHLVESYRRHLAETDEIEDAPTARLLRRMIAEEDDHLRWGTAVLRQALTAGPAAERATTWERHLRAALAAIGGVRAEDQSATGPVYRRSDPPVWADHSAPARDGRFNLVSVQDYYVPSMGDEPSDILRHSLYSNAYGEMEALDVLGRVLAGAPELPWAMRMDLVRQLWDEARHAEMSWRRMEELGGVPDPVPPIPALILAPMAGLSDPLERLLVLQRVIEGRATERHRYRVTYIGKELGDPITARLYEYIVADERAHIGYSEWIDRLVGHDPERIKRLDQIHARAEGIFESILQRRTDQTAGTLVARR